MGFWNRYLVAFVLVTNSNFCQKTVLEGMGDRRSFVRLLSDCFYMNDDKKKDMRLDSLGIFVLEVRNESLLFVYAAIFCDICALRILGERCVPTAAR